MFGVYFINLRRALAQIQCLASWIFQTKTSLCSQHALSSKENHETVLCPCCNGACKLWKCAAFKSRRKSNQNRIWKPGLTIWLISLDLTRNWSLKNNIYWTDTEPVKINFVEHEPKPKLYFKWFGLDVLLNFWFIYIGLELGKKLKQWFSNFLHPRHTLLPFQTLRHTRTRMQIFFGLHWVFHIFLYLMHYGVLHKGLKFLCNFL